MMPLLMASEAASSPLDIDRNKDSQSESEHERAKKQNAILYSLELAWKNDVIISMKMQEDKVAADL
ncbi:hypothetical protein VDF76_15890 [Xanthomonas campestris pv. raphani]|nr:hypothetical protein [Xanthomonas campestris]MEA9748454.1 hypothetical protein [Xanthomonas campestris pv. raphani]MEA9930349.1 hypothetical protein [Xanthomonas campestris pv. raphani]